VEETDGHLLGGRVRYAQPRIGFRSGIEPVLLAAAVPARPGERILEGGSGAGAALLCLFARVQGISGVGVEQDQTLVQIADANARTNGWPDLTFMPGDIEAVVLPGMFDHACANPPYHQPEGTRSPMPERNRAKRGSAGLLGTWANALARTLRPRGSLTVIIPAAMLPSCLDAVNAAGCQACAILPLWPKKGRPAKLALVQGIKGGRSPLRLLPGLVLHGPEGDFTAEAHAVLRDGAALAMA
jgi:tRNA1Val (adenine37-N6)-methyltransferase